MSVHETSRGRVRGKTPEAIKRLQREITPTTARTIVRETVKVTEARNKVQEIYSYAESKMTNHYLDRSLVELMRYADRESRKHYEEHQKLMLDRDKEIFELAAKLKVATANVYRSDTLNRKISDHYKACIKVEKATSKKMKEHNDAYAKHVESLLDKPKPKKKSAKRRWPWSKK